MSRVMNFSNIFDYRCPGKLKINKYIFISNQNLIRKNITMHVCCIFKVNLEYQVLLILQ